MGAPDSRQGPSSAPQTGLPQDDHGAEATPTGNDRRLHFNAFFLDRYLLSELFIPFMIGLFTFAIIMLGDVARQLGAALIGSNVPPILIAKYLVYHAPHALSWSMPVGTVVGVAMAITMLANRGEITAIRAGGVSFPRLCRSIILAGLFASALSFWLGEYVAPPAARKAREAFAEIGLSQPIVQDQSNVFFRDDKEQRIFHVAHMNPQTNELEQVTIWEHDAQGRLTRIVAARWAEMRRNVWFLREGSAVTLDQYGDQRGPVERFAEQEITLQAALQDYYSSRKTSSEMSATELGDMVRTMREAGGETQKLAVQYHFKYSIPLACLIFALIAAPISFRFAHYGSFVGIVIAVMIIFLYNGVRSWTLAFGLAGSLDPVLAGWIPDVFFGGLGVYLLAATK
jgi:lipopolysaccharide export system permease protein